MRTISLHAGGEDKTSDLMELYADIGYQHLVPAYAKYKWSWIQYYMYNVDVQLVLCLLLGGVVYCVTKLCKCCCRCRLRNNKTKKD